MNIETLYHSIEWNSTVRLAVATFLDNFGEELKKLEAERDRQYILSCDSEKEKTQRLLDEGRPGLLLVAGIYFTDDPVHEQIMKNLRLDYSFEDLIDILETIGERDNCIVPIFIDALNETWNRKLWKSGLPAIIDKIKENPMVNEVKPPISLSLKLRGSKPHGMDSG